MSTIPDYESMGDEEFEMTCLEDKAREAEAHWKECRRLRNENAALRAKLASYRTRKNDFARQLTKAKQRISNLRETLKEYQSDSLKGSA